MKNNPFTPGFQRRLLAMLLQVPETYTRFTDIWDPTYFDESRHRKIMHAYVHIRVIGREQPTELSVGHQLTKGYDMTGEVPSDVTDLINELEVLYRMSVENIDYSLDEIKTWAQQHALMQAVETSVSFIQSGEPEKIREVINKAIKVGDNVRLAGYYFYHAPPQLPAEIIPGLLYRKQLPFSLRSLNLLKHGILLRCALPSEWENIGWVFPRVNRSAPCTATWSWRKSCSGFGLIKSRQALGVTRADLDGHVDFLNLKGKPNQIDRMLARIRASRPANDPWGLGVIDPIYKLYGSGDGKENAENSANVIGAMFEKLEQFAHELEAAIFLAHHFKKGPKGASRDIDLGSGSGVFARAPDCLLFLKELVTEEPTWSCIPILRYFPRIAPFGLRIGTGDQWPLLIRGDSVDLAKEVGKPGAPTKCTVEDVVAILPAAGLRGKDWMDQTMKDLHCSDKVLYQRKIEAIDAGFVHADGDSSKRDTLFVPTEEGRKVVQLAGRKTKIVAAAAHRGKGKHFATR